MSDGHFLCSTNTLTIILNEDSGLHSFNNIFVFFVILPGE